VVVRGGVGVRRAAVVVGREIELERLLRAVRDAHAGRDGCILLVGEGGVGKTRLLAECTGLAHRLGIGALAGRAPIAAPTAFSVVAEALRSWLRGHTIEAWGDTFDARTFDAGLRVVLPEWHAQERAPDLSPAQLRLLALEGVVQLVRNIAAQSGGAVVVLDDVATLVDGTSATAVPDDVTGPASSQPLSAPPSRAAATSTRAIPGAPRRLRTRRAMITAP